MRLFVAIDLPNTIKDRLGELKTNIPTARWVNVENMHLTLRFIGEVDDAKVDPLKSQLVSVESPSFDLSVFGVGQFPKNPRKPPRVLWVGFKEQPLLMQLQRQIETQIRSLKYPADKKPFSPHLTLARLKSPKPVREASKFQERYHSLKLDPFRVEEFHLYSSELSPTGAMYTQEATYPLNKKA